ncbi:MAG: hypothetical protein PHX70_14355 [Clostridium sp.]|nr:hypothetical protein [Clostridium sp.]
MEIEEELIEKICYSIINVIEEKRQLSLICEKQQEEINKYKEQQNKELEDNRKLFGGILTSLVEKQ